MQPMPPIVVFSDLDDTLFEPHAFSVDASARRALNRLERQQLPLVFCSSRTRAEIELIQQELGINHPFVSENGAAVFLPRGYFAFRAARVHRRCGLRHDSNSADRTQKSSLRCIVQPAGLVSVSSGSATCPSKMSHSIAMCHCCRRGSQSCASTANCSVSSTASPEPSFDWSKPCAQPASAARVVAAITTWERSTTTSAVTFSVACSVEPLGEVVTVAFGDHRSAASLLRHADIPLVVRSNNADETTCLLANVPAARLSAADSVGAWAETILEISNAIQRGRRICSS